MKKLIIAFVAGLALAVSIGAGAQLIYGNTFPFWNVTGPLTVDGATTLNGATTLAGAATLSSTVDLTSAPTISALTASRAVFTNSSKLLVSNAITGSGNVVMSASPTMTGTLNVPIINITTTASPASNAACTAGRTVWDADYIYVCTATGVWKRAALTGGY